MKIANRSILSIGLAILAGAPASFAAWPSTSRHNSALVLQWKERLEVANERLQLADWRAGFAVASSVLDDMHERLTGGEASGDLLAVALLFRAIGRAGLGDDEGGAWDFGVAQALYPPYEKVDLKPYGRVGEILSKHRYTNGAPPGLPVPREGTSTGGEVRPPRKAESVAAEFPLGKRVACDQQTVAVKTVIDEQGRPTRPSLPPNTDPVLALAAFEAARQWKFEPATQDGRPVAVNFVLMVSFKVRGC